jgi:hypothetical protein
LTTDSRFHYTDVCARYEKCSCSSISHRTRERTTHGLTIRLVRRHLHSRPGRRRARVLRHARRLDHRPGRKPRSLRRLDLRWPSTMGVDHRGQRCHGRALGPLHPGRRPRHRGRQGHLARRHRRRRQDRRARRHRSHHRGSRRRAGRALDPVPRQDPTPSRPIACARRSRSGRRVAARQGDATVSGARDWGSRSGSRRPIPSAGYRGRGCRPDPSACGQGGAGSRS